jgi:hypothetical protein
MGVHLCRHNTEGSNVMWAVVDRIVASRAVLELEDGEVIEIASKHLPQGAVAGSVVNISIGLDPDKEEELRKLWAALRGKGASSP